MNNNEPTYEELKNQIAELKKLNKTLLSNFGFQNEKEGIEIVELIKTKEKAYKDVVETTSDLITIVDNNGIILFVNHSSEKIYGLPPKECIGKLAFDFILPEDKEFTQSKFAEWVKSENNYFSFENRLINLSGEIFYVAWNIHIERNNEEVIKMTAIARDITKQKEIERELIKAKEKAEENEKLKSAFLANMSHEIRTPMNAILGFSNLLKNQDLSNETKTSYLDLIDSSGKRLITLISDIVDISKIDVNQLSINRNSLNLNELINTLQIQFSIQSANAEVLLIKESSLNDNDCFVIADEIRLTQILSNLIENAQKFTRKGQIEFGYTVEGKFLHFFVKDTGIGIDPLNHKHVFDRFRQIDNEFSQLKTGTGLGLSIVKGLVELLGGEIWLESELNKGAKFFFSIPHIASNPVIVPVKPDQEFNVDTRNKITILIAEDNKINFMYLEALLKGEKYKILHVLNGQEAVNLVKENSSIDLVLMDISMPIMNGLEATKRIRKFNSTIPIIGQSGHTMDDDVNRALDAGFNAYLSKPFSETEFFKILKEHIKNLPK